MFVFQRYEYTIVKCVNFYFSNIGVILLNCNLLSRVLWTYSSCSARWWMHGCGCRCGYRSFIIWAYREVNAITYINWKHALLNYAACCTTQHDTTRHDMTHTLKNVPVKNLIWNHFIQNKRDQNRAMHVFIRYGNISIDMLKLCMANW